MADRVHEGFIAFTGIPDEYVINSSYTVGHGISPGTLSIVTVPFTGPYPLSGTAKIIYDGASWSLHECRVMNVTQQTDGSGRTTLLWTIFDRRWKWRFGWLEGHYNLREVETQIRPSRLRAAQDLARLALAAMGETKYDVRQLPNGEFPETHWEGNPAECLAQLVEQLGCRVAFDPLTDHTLIVRVGEGALLPANDSLMDGGLTLDPPELPDKFVFIANRSLYQVDIPLEPCGDEDDWTVKPINALSYRPRLGWGKETPQEFTGVHEKFRERAKRCIWRWYRPKMPLNVFGEQIQDRERILPLEDKMLQWVRFDTNDEGKVRVWDIRERGDSIVFGDVWDGYESFTGEAHTIKTQFGEKVIYERGFSVDAEKGIVKFSEPLYLVTDQTGRVPTGPLHPDKTQISPAKLWLRTAIGIRDPVTFAWKRYHYTHVPRGKKLGTQPHYFTREESYLARYQIWDGRTQRDFDNRQRLEDEAKYYMEQELRTFENLTPGTATYVGFLPLRVDGAIQQITWTLDANGQLTTTASRNDEHSWMVQSFKERRREEQLRHIVAQEAKARQTTQRTPK